MVPDVTVPRRSRERADAAKTNDDFLDKAVVVPELLEKMYPVVLNE